MINQRAKDAQRRITKTLTSPQRSFLGGLADGARRILIDRGAIEAHDETAKDWRHRETREATKPLDPQGLGWTISEAPAYAFDAIKAHFEMLSGRAEKAMETLMSDPNEMRQMAHAISVAARECGVGENYISGICKRQSRGRRTTWRNVQEGKAVLIALKQHAACKAFRAAAEPLAAAGAV